jgi:hypothetical protein
VAQEKKSFKKMKKTLATVRCDVRFALDMKTKRLLPIIVLSVLALAATSFNASARRTGQVTPPPPPAPVPNPVVSPN